MELFEDPEFLNAQKSIKELVRARSIKDASKIIVKASPSKFFLVFLIFILPLSLFQLLFDANTRFVLALFTWDLYHKSSPEYLLSDQKLVHQELVNDSIHGCFYLILFSTFYHFSTSAMTFAIACIHVSKPLSYISILSAIPRILKRLAITLLHALPLIFLIYTSYLAVFTLLVTVIPMVPAKTIYVVVPLFIATVFLCFGYVYVLDARVRTTAFLNSANVVSVLEPSTYGSAAIRKSKLLLQEKKTILENLVLHHLANELCVCIAYFVMVYDMNIIIKVSIISLCVIGVAAGNFLELTAQNLMYYECTRYDNQVLGKRVSDDIEMQNGNLVIGKDNCVEGDKLEV